MSDVESEQYVEISAVVTRADGTVEDLGVLDTEQCPTCNARMRPYELREHEPQCAVLELVEEVEALNE